MTILVDSDVLIEVSRGRDESIVSEWLDLSVSEARILVSAVTVAELWTEARPAEHETLEALFEALICVPADAGIARRAGDYLRTYRKSHSVELADALIAATAVESEAMLWTRNRKHYPMKDVSFFPGGKT